MPKMICNEECQMNTSNTSKQEYDIVPMHFETTPKIRHRTLNLDLTIRLRHCGERADCEFGRIGADLVGSPEVGFVRRAQGRRCTTVRSFPLPPRSLIPRFLLLDRNAFIFRSVSFVLVPLISPRKCPTSG